MTQKKIENCLKLAKNVCYYSDNKRTRIGAVLMYKNCVISVGWNLESKTSPIQKEFNKLRGYDTEASASRNTIHAEMMAMLRAKNYNVDWKKVMLFVYRIKKDDTAGLSRPCPACMGYAKALGIRHIYYSTDNNGWTYEQI